MYKSHIKLVKPFLKIFLFVSLAIVFYIFYFDQVVEVYQDKLANEAKSGGFLAKIALPSMTFCLKPPFKPSVQAKYGINPKIFLNNWKPELFENMTIFDLFDELTYKIPEDLKIMFEPHDGPFELNVGNNVIEYMGKDEQQKRIEIQVQEIKTLERGKCFSVQGADKDQLITPSDSFYVNFFKGNEEWKDVDVIEEVILMIGSPDEHLNAAVPEMPGTMVNTFEFLLKEFNYANYFYHEERHTYVKDCKDNGMLVYQNFAMKLMQEKDKMQWCKNTCTDITLSSVMGSIENGWDLCPTIEDYYCIASQFDLFRSQGIKTEKSCSITNLVPREAGRARSTADDSKFFEIFVFSEPKVTVYEEYFIYDSLNLIGTIGGTLGLFFGFSFFDFGVMIIDYCCGKLQ